MSNIEIAMYVVFGMVAGWPILLLVSASNSQGVEVAEEG